MLGRTCWNHIPPFVRKHHQQVQLNREWLRWQLLAKEYYHVDTIDWILAHLDSLDSQAHHFAMTLEPKAGRDRSAYLSL